MKKTRSGELEHSPQVPQPARGRQSVVGTGSLADPKPGHLLLKSSAHKAHSLPHPVSQAQLHCHFLQEALINPFRLLDQCSSPAEPGPGASEQEDWMAETIGWESSETKAGGEGSQAWPDSWYLPADRGLRLGKAGWVGWGEPKTRAPKLAVALAGSHPYRPQALLTAGLNINLQLDFQGLGNGDAEREAGSAPGAQQTGKRWSTKSQVQTQAPTSWSSPAQAGPPKPSPAASASPAPALGALGTQNYCHTLPSRGNP